MAVIIKYNNMLASFLLGFCGDHLKPFDYQLFSALNLAP